MKGGFCEAQSPSSTSFQDTLLAKTFSKVFDSGQQQQLVGESELPNFAGFEEHVQNSLLYQQVKDDSIQSCQLFPLKGSLNSTQQQSLYPASQDLFHSQEEGGHLDRSAKTPQKMKSIYDRTEKGFSRQLSKENSIFDDRDRIDKGSVIYQDKNGNQQNIQPDEVKEQNLDEYDKYGNKYVTPFIWRKNFFKLLLLTNRFIFFSKKVLLFFRPMELTEHQLTAINDRSAQTYHEAQNQNSNTSELYRPKKRSKLEKKIRIFYLILKKQMKCIIVPTVNICSYIYDHIIYLDREIPLANPFNVIMLFWDFLIILFSVGNLLFIPYYICFISNSDHESYTTFFQRLSYTVFLVDIFVSMNTSNYVKGELVKERIKVIKSYIKNQLILDAICLTCIIFEEPFNIPLLRMFFVLKMIKVGDLIEKNREFFQIDDKYSSLVNLILLMTKIMYLCHLFACFWYKIGRFVQGEGQQSWIDAFVGAEENDNLYINAIYFAAITITTVGYGDIAPKAKLEKVFIIVMAFISCANFGYALNQIGSIIQEFNAKKEQYRVNIAAINKYMKEREVNKLLQSKARKYFEYIYSQSENLNNQSDTALSILSTNLQNQIKKEVNLKSLKKIPFLFDTFQKECLEKVATKIHEKCFGIGESILDQFEQSQPAIYLIIKGEVTIFLKDKQQIYAKIFKQLQLDDVFGEYQFFSQSQDSHFTATSTGYNITLVYLLIILITFKKIILKEFDDLLAVLEDFPIEREKFSQFKDNVKVYNLMQDIKHSCYSCKSGGHLVNSCPYIMYSPRRDKVFYQFNKQHKTFMDSFHRKVFKKIQSLMIMKDVQAQCQSFLDNLEEEEDGSLQNLSQNQIQILELGVGTGGNLKQQRPSNQKSKPSLETGSLTSIDGKQLSTNLPQLKTELSAQTIIKVNEDPLVQQQQTAQQRQSVASVGNNMLSDQKEKQDDLASRRRSSKMREDSTGTALSKLTNLKIGNIISSSQKKEEHSPLQNIFSSITQAQQPSNIMANNNAPSVNNINNNNMNAIQQNIVSLFQQFFHEFKHFIGPNPNKDLQTRQSLNDGTGTGVRKSNLNADFDDLKQNQLLPNLNKKSYINLDQLNIQQQCEKRVEIQMAEYGDSCEIDALKQYEHYFPKNNANKVLMEYFKKFYKSLSLQREQNKKRKQSTKRTSKYNLKNK